jgi:hypothetical protein
MSRGIDAGNYEHGSTCALVRFPDIGAVALGTLCYHLQPMNLTFGERGGSHAQFRR